MKLLIPAVLAGVLVSCSSSSSEQTKKPAAPPSDDSPDSEPASPPPSGDYDPCAGKSCGDPCTICPPADVDCVETMEVKVCNASGECSGQATDCP